MSNMYHGEYIYFGEDYYTKPKEIFKFCGREIANINNNNLKINLLDLGCARGEFLYYLSKKFKNLNLEGWDNSKKLIDFAKKQKFLENITFNKLNVTNQIKKRGQYSIITSLGLVEAFQNTKALENFFKNIKNIQTKESYFFLFGRFNEKNVDVISKFLNFDFVNKWQITSTWSEQTIIKIANKNKYNFIKKKKFMLNFKNKPKKDPMRAFNANTEYGKKFMNGLGMMFDLSLLIFKKK